MLNNKFEFSERRLKNLEIFGEVGGSEKWKRIALPELLLLHSALHSADCLLLSEAQIVLLVTKTDKYASSFREVDPGAPLV